MDIKKNRCHEKKCKKKCVEYVYYFNRENPITYKPVFNEPTSLGAPISFSRYDINDVYENRDFSGKKIGFFESNVNVLITDNGKSNQTVYSLANITGVFLDGLSSIRFTLTFSSPDGRIPNGTYKTTAYSTNGIYLNKKCFLTVIYDNTNIVTVN